MDASKKQVNTLTPSFNVNRLPTEETTIRSDCSLAAIIFHFDSPDGAGLVTGPKRTDGQVQSNRGRLGGGRVGSSLRRRIELSFRPYISGEELR